MDKLLSYMKNLDSETLFLNQKECIEANKTTAKVDTCQDDE